LFWSRKYYYSNIDEKERRKAYQDKANSYLEAAEGDETKLRQFIKDQEKKISNLENSLRKAQGDLEISKAKRNADYEALDHEITACNEKLQENIKVIKDCIVKSGVVKSEVGNFFEAQVGMDKILVNQEIACKNLQIKLDSMISILFSSTLGGQDLPSVLKAQKLKDYEEALNAVGVESKGDCFLTEDEMEEFYSEFLDILNEDFPKLLNKKKKLKYMHKKKIDKLLTGKFFWNEKDKAIHQTLLLKKIHGFPEYLFGNSKDLQGTSKKQVGRLEQKPTLKLLELKEKK